MSNQSQQQLNDESHLELQSGINEQPLLNKTKTDVQNSDSILKNLFDAGGAQSSNQHTRTHLNQPQADLEIKSAFKSSCTICFSRMIQFVCDLLAEERPYSKHNPIRVQFIKLITEQASEKNQQLNKDAKTKNIYSKFVYDCIKYCNQIDLHPELSTMFTNTDTERTEALRTVNKNVKSMQLSIFGLIESLIRHTPALFAGNFRLKMFFYDDTSAEYDNQIDEDVDLETTNTLGSFYPTLTMIHKTLIDHLNTTKLDSLESSGTVLNSLILLSKLYTQFIERVETASLLSSDREYSPSLILINPMLRRHLKMANSSSLSNFVRELDNVFENTPRFIDLLAKFFIYINLLVESLKVNSKVYSIAIGKLKDLFEWNNSNFNVSDMQIDSISICKSTHFRPNNENSLDNLLVLIVNYEQTNRDDSGQLKKIKFCSSQTKRLVNILNEIDASKHNLLEESILNELEIEFSLTSKLINVRFCS